MLSWDYARSLSVPLKTYERMSENFANTLGYNVYVFGVANECQTRHLNYINGEECSSKRADSVANMVCHYLTNIASSEIISVQHLIIV